jgi:hypothetical protein
MVNVKIVIICLYLGFAIIFEVISECVVVYFGPEKQFESHTLLSSASCE